MLNAFNNNKVLYYDENQFPGSVYRNLGGLNDENNEPSKTPFFINNIGKVLNSVDKWKEHLPSIGMFFKVSANPDPVLIRILNCYGIKFSCSTGPEIENLIKQGIPASNIIFSGLCKLSRHIRTASSNLVISMCFGTLAELKRIIFINPEAKLFLRFNLESLPNGNYSINLAATGLDEIRVILDAANSANALIYGLHFDLPKNATSITFENAFKLLKDIVKIASQEYQISVKCVNIGSGVPSYSEDNDSLFSHFADASSNFSFDHPLIELIAEPGEFVIKNSVDLCCTVVGKRSVSNNSGNVSQFYYLNDGLYGSLSSIIYHQYKPEVLVLKQDCDNQENNPPSEATFWGPTCDSMDKICTLEFVPQLDVGDLVFFKNVGLYGRSCASNFNGFDIPNNCHLISYQRLESLGIDRATADDSRERYTQSVAA